MGRKTAKQEKIGNLLKAAVLRQIGDPIAAIEKTGLSLVDEAKRRLSGDDAFKARTIRMSCFT
jgi:hypothetical protein